MEDGSPPGGTVSNTRSGSSRGSDTAALGSTELDEELVVGARIERYVVLECCGRGGMGVVYAAYDPRLDRKIALKLLAGGDVDDRRRQRLLREAQALAQLAHPNVITVFDVGSLGDHLFLAMEFVAGETLRAWLRQPRPWREVLRVFLEAGRGLAAAHAAGVIHRDFKPENVLVGSDGRARVADFGLARLTLEEVTTASASRAPAAASMTASGTVAGTPAYMSPEQKAGERLDARSDQYSFCVALFEALDGQRPDLDRRPPPQAARAPAHVRRALSRGLLGTPAERYPDMDALLGQLARDPRTTRRSAAALGALGVTALASVVALRSPAQPELLCRGGAAKLAGVWDEASRQAVRAAFATTGKPFAADAWSGVDHALTRNSAAWVAEWTQACEATHVRGEQSAATLDLRMECLDGQRQEMRGFIEILTSADAAVVQRAPLAAQSLLDVERCRRTEALRQLVRPPHNAVDTARVQALQLQLANAVALRKAAKYAAAAAATNEVLIGARALGYSPMVGEARFILAITQDDRGDLPGAVAGMREAAAVSEAGHDDHRRAEALAELVRVLAEQAHYDEADGYAVLAEAVISRAGGDEDLRVRLLKARGEVLEGRGKYDEAVTLCKQIVGLRERSAEARPAQLAVALLNLGEAYHLQGDRDESIATSKRALALFERELGKVHPTVGLVLNNIGAAYAEKNESVEALHYLQRALTLREAALGADNMEVATNAQNVGIVLVDLGQFEQARPLIEHTLELRQKLFGPTHPQVATSWWALALLQLKRGDPATALPLARRALDIRRQTLAADHAILALSLDQVAEAELGVGHAARALPLSEQAVAITERQHEMVPELALQRVNLARALWASGGDRVRARKLALAARAVFAGLGTPMQPDLRKIDAWLHDHGGDAR